MSRWYGSVNNRIEENHMFCETIKVGTPATEYMWSDRHPYEVTAVRDQKHVSIRGMGHRKKADSLTFSNEWEYFSDESKPCIDLTKRGKYWYITHTITPQEAEEILNGDDIQAKIWACNNDFNLPEIIENGKPKTKYHRINISFGVMEYYYDYEF